MANQLRTALSAAGKTGWAVGNGQLDELRREGWWLGWETHSTRGHPDDADELRPLAKANAHRASLSAVHGAGGQPLHSDGAHLLEPSRWLLLVGTVASAVPTLLWPFDADAVDGQVGDALREGLFTVVNGRTSFLAPALAGTILRFDPGCMRPSDGRAMIAAEFLTTRRATALKHAWTNPNTFLLVDNHRVLHARADATSEPNRLLHRITFDLPVGVKR